MNYTPEQISSLYCGHISSLIQSKAENIDLVRDPYSGVYIYGAGDLGSLAIEYCESCSIPILGILDRIKTGVMYTKKHAYSILSPDLIPEHIKKNTLIAVAVATVPFRPIRSQLESCGWEYVIPFYRLTAMQRSGHPLRNGWFLGDLSCQEIETVEWICRQWGDVESLVHYAAFLSWHKNNTELDLMDYSIKPEDRYAIQPLLDFLTCRNQQILDIGSHHGESGRRLSNAGIFFSEYILIEPDPISREYLTSIAYDIFPKSSQIIIRSDVLGATRCLGEFAEGFGYCSQIWPRSTVREIVPVDDLHLSPDFIKIHTEGSEWDILQGARNTIIKASPGLAFSVYHSRSGFCNDIAGAMRMFPGYHWFFPYA